MKSLTYRKQVFIFAIWIVVVLVLFRVIDDRQIAALLAGAGFILLPGLVLYSEVSRRGNRIHIFIILVFLLISALPIFLLRLANWGTEFATLELFGIPATQLHRVSNFTYLGMLISAMALHRRERSLGK